MQRKSVHDQLMEMERADRLQRDKLDITSQIRRVIYRLPEDHPAVEKLNEALVLVEQS